MDEIVEPPERERAGRDQFPLFRRDRVGAGGIEMVVIGAFVGDQQVRAPIGGGTQHVRRRGQADPDLAELAILVAVLAGVHRRLAEVLFPDEQVHQLFCRHRKAPLLGEKRGSKTRRVAPFA